MIRLDNVCRHYFHGNSVVKALNGVSLEIAAGELVTISGRSGSGKTTLMNLLGCLDRPSSGEYYLDGLPVSKQPHDKLAGLRRERLGFVFQNFHLLKHLTALENVELPLIYSGIAPELRGEIAAGALAAVGLSDRLAHTPAQLSGGQQQRVAIARAVVTSPSVILADEPTGNLDSESGSGIVDLLIKMNGLGHTVIIITHDKQLAGIARRRLTIDGGRLV